MAPPTKRIPSNAQTRRHRALSSSPAPSTTASPLLAKDTDIHVTDTASNQLVNNIAAAQEELFERASLAVIKPEKKLEIGNGAVDRYTYGDNDASAIPRVLRFPLLVLGTLVLSAAGYSVLGEAAGRGELSEVSRTLRGWWEVGAVVGWRTFELALGWYGDLDGYDITALGLLSRGPTLYLLSAFYDISTPTVLSSLAIDFASTYIPFRLLRPLAPTHSGSSRLRIPNKEIANDYSIQALSTTLAAAIYSVTIFTAYKTVLPRTLVLHFDGVKSLEDVYRSHWLPLLPLMAGFGAAVKEFVFTPALVVIPTPTDLLNTTFDPSTASLLDTIRYNFWGYSTRTKTIIKRTAILMAVSGAHTFVQTWFTLEGVEVKGAAVYAGVWVVAAGLAGGALGFVGAV